MKRANQFAPLAILLALVVVMSGCSAGQQVTAADVIAKMRETVKTTQTSQAVVDLSLTINKEGIKTLAQGLVGSSATSGATGKDWTAQLPDQAAATIKTWKQAPDKARVEVDSSTLPGVKGATLVYDGQKAYALDPAHNTVYSATPSKLADKIPPELKAMMQSGDVQQEIDKLIAAADVKLVGTEKVAGLDAYKLEITPKADAADALGLPATFKMQAGIIIKDLHATLWVDTNRWIPLKVTLMHPNLGQFTSTISQIDLNKPIDASQFVLQVPAGAKTVDLDAVADKMAPKSTTLPQARSQATADGWKLLEPSYVPNNATLIELQQLQQSAVTFMLNYSAPSTSFTIVESKSQPEKALGDGFSGINAPSIAGAKEVQVRGVKAKAFSPDNGQWTALTWQEKDSGIWVAIYGKLALAEVTKIAEGLK